jgi:hypothetical protein
MLQCETCVSRTRPLFLRSLELCAEYITVGGLSIGLVVEHSEGWCWRGNGEEGNQYMPKSLTLGCAEVHGSGRYHISTL